MDPVRDPRDVDLPPGQTALLLVDMQAAWCVPAPPGSGRREAGHPFHARLRSAVLPNQQRLLALVRRLGLDVLHTVIEALTLDGRDISLDHRLSGILIPKGSPGARILPELQPAPNEIVLPKSSSGVFNSTAIDYVLRNLGTRRLVVAGVFTDQCVDMAVRDAADRGYHVTLVEDACAADSDERHAAALRVLRGYAWVTDTATVIARLGGEGASGA